MSRRSFNSVRSYFFRDQCARIDREQREYGGAGLEAYDLDDFRRLHALATSQAVDHVQASLNLYNHATRSWDRPWKDLSMKTVYRINWDIPHACGTFPETYATEDEAQRAADIIEADNRAEGVWDEDCGCEVIAVEEPDEDDIEAAAAAEEQSLDYFNRYIAGDR